MKIGTMLAIAAAMCIMAWYGVAASILLHYGLHPKYAFIAGVFTSTICFFYLKKKWSEMG